MNKKLITDNYYQIYLDKVRALARTITIKSEETALYLNKLIKNKYGSNSVSDNKSEWIYYKNICGEYHFSNEKMIVTSMDTLEKIEFNKENLKYHTATKAEYQYGTRRYEELITRYPEQEMLILGILYPAELNTAISSNNYTILSYKKDLVEPNEYSLISDLQDWLYGFKVRWINRNYSYSDDLIIYYYVALMHLSLIPVILNLRKDKCKTNEAHSYHVQRYLASHGFLDEYLDAMTTKQSLKFYKNINWIERNIGSRESQSWLYENALTERDIPISEYQVKHNNKDIIKNLYPEVYFKKYSINGLEKITERDNLNVKQMLSKEEDIASGNKNYINENNINIDTKLKLSPSNTLKTKVLESSMYDYSNSKPIRLADVILNLWLDLADRNLFTAVILYNDPLTGETIPLDSKDAFILYFYAYVNSFFNIELKTIPLFYANRVPRDIPFNKNIPLEVLPSNFNDDAFIEAITNLMIKPEKYISVLYFYNYCNQVYKNANTQLFLVSVEEHLMRRSYKEAAVTSFYCDRLINLTGSEKPIAYKEWFNSKNLDFKNYTSKEWGLLAKSILDYVSCSKSNDVKSLRSIQTAMLRLTKQLSSYSVQFLQEMNDDNSLSSGLTSIREGDVNESEQEHDYIEINRIRILDTNCYEKEKNDIITMFDDSEWSYESSEEEHVDVEASLIIETKPSESITYMHVETGIQCDAKLPNVDHINPRKLIVVPGIEDYLKLSKSEQSKVIDVYGHDYWYPDKCSKEPDTKNPLIWEILNNNLNGFDYTTTRPLTLKNLNGFDYDETQRLSLLTKIGGFDYLSKPKLHLIDDLNGFDYNNKDWLYIDELITYPTVNGFKVSDDNLVPLDTLITNTTIDGFYNDEILDISTLNGNFIKDESIYPEKLIDVKTPTLTDNDFQDIDINK